MGDQLVWAWQNKETGRYSHWNSDEPDTPNLYFAMLFPTRDAALKERARGLAYELIEVLMSPRREQR